METHRAYQAALADQLGRRGDAVVLTAALDQDRLTLVRAAHERADWVLTLDRYLGIDHYSGADGSYVLDYAPDFLEGLGPRLTVTTTHRGEVERLLADAMADLDLATVDRSVRVVLDHLQVVSGRLALRLLGHTTLATEAVSLAAVVAYLRRRGALDGAFVVEVVLGHDAHAAEVRWRISTDGSPHLFVLGIPGQGKSVTTRHILNAFATQGLPALVLDFHGDMAAAPPGGAAVLDAAQGLPISPFETRGPHTRYAEAASELAEVIGFVCGLGEIQRNVTYEGVRELYRQHGFGAPGGPTGLPTMDQLAAAVAAAEGTGRGRNVAARLRPLTDFGLFVPSGGERGFADLLRQGVVVDVHRLMEQVQLAAGAFLLRKVYREMFGWGQTKQLRLAVVLDEARTGSPKTSRCRRS